MKNVTVSLSGLYEMFGGNLEHGEIVKSVEGNNDYYDLYVNDIIVCMDGETCKILKESEDSFVLCSKDDQGSSFILNRGEMNVGAFGY